MSERKVLNKYYPPDFDPSKIPKRKAPRNDQQKVRLMAPFSMRCQTCGEYIYKGKKFNARKETVQGESYLTLKVFRFYIRCPMCAAEITFKTDLRNQDYVAEHGAVRNFDPLLEEKLLNREAEQAKKEDEEMDPLKALENQTKASRRETDMLNSLDALRTESAKRERVSIDRALSYVKRSAADGNSKSTPGSASVGHSQASSVDVEDFDAIAREAFKTKRLQQRQRRQV